MPFTCRLLLVSLIAFTASVATADDLTTTSGKKLVGKLVSIDAQGATFQSGEAKAVVSGKDIVVIDLGSKIEQLPKGVKINEIELTDGSTIRGGKFLIKGRKVETELATIPNGVAAPSIDLPLGSVFSIMRGAEDTKNRDAWKKILGSRGKRDLYVVREPEGLNFVQGTVLNGDDAGTKLTFEKEGGGKEVLLLSRATGGLVFSQPTPPQVPQTLCRVLDVFGNSLVAQSVTLTSEGATVTTVSGVVVNYASTAAIAKFDYNQGNVAYLSDLTPTVDEPAIPADEKGLRLNPLIPYTRDRGLAGEPLKLGNDTFPKGMMIAPDTVLTFTISGDYREFKAVLGLPESTPDANLEAKVTIETDGNVVFSETLKRKDKPKAVVLDMKGVKQLRVTIEADLPVNGNRVIFADARVQK